MAHMCIAQNSLGVGCMHEGPECQHKSASEQFHAFSHSRLEVMFWCFDFVCNGSHLDCMEQLGGLTAHRMALENVNRSLFSVPSDHSLLGRTVIRSH